MKLVWGVDASCCSWKSLLVLMIVTSIFSYPVAMGEEDRELQVDLAQEFLPLCGTPTKEVEMNVVTRFPPFPEYEYEYESGAELEEFANLGIDVYGTVAIDFPGCCSLNSPSTTRQLKQAKKRMRSPEEGDEHTDLSNPTGAGHRVVVLQTPLKDYIPGYGEIMMLNESTCADYAVSFRPFFAEKEAIDEEGPSSSCCLKCSCYGDPMCRSFNGTKKLWVLCDGRTPPRHPFYSPQLESQNQSHTVSVEKRCRITEAMCETQKDHAGNVCEYLSSNVLGQGWSVIEKGSPCVPNFGSPPAKILMYEVPERGFSLEVTHGERGVITSVLLELATGHYELTAETCEWVVLTEDDEAELPAYFARHMASEVVVGSELSEVEEDISWNLVDPDTGIAVHLRCFGNKVFTVESEGENVARLYNRRINVESISDPILNRPDVEEVSGFCSSGEINTELATTDHTEYIEKGDLCLAGLENFSRAEVFRELCQNEALPQAAIGGCIHSFCQQYFYPNYDTAYACERDMVAADNTGKIDALGLPFCKAIIFSTETAKLTECVDEWQEFGPIQTIRRYYLDESSCVPWEAVEDRVSPSTCEEGIIIQRYVGVAEGDSVSADLSWEDMLFLPSQLCTESEILRFDGCSYPEFFESKLRFVQYFPPTSCAIRNQCSRVSSFTTLLGVSTPPFPTALPTSSPTKHPTVVPTTSPTLQPSVSPTTSPTLRPSVSPTLQPSESPSVSPVSQPTRTPTGAPIPLDLLTNPPIPSFDVCEVALCSTETEYVDLQLDEDLTATQVNFSFSSCCPDTYNDHLIQCPLADAVLDEASRSVGISNYICGDKYTFEPVFAVKEDDCSISDTLDLTVRFKTADSSSCCDTCQCYGDPRCFSFDGQYDEFVLCDGRELPEVSDERCIIRRDTCSAQLDHEGHICQWQEEAPDKADPIKQTGAENTYNTVRYGSPCKYNTALSGPPVMKLYEVVDPPSDLFRISVEHYDRGYIQSVFLETAQAKYSITVEDCLQGKPWEEDVSNLGEALDKFTFQKLGQESLWTVVEASTAIEVRIRCTGVMYHGEFTVPFINVEYIHEPNRTRSASAVATGFCATGIIAEKALATTEHTDLIVSGQFCSQWNKDLNHVRLRESMKLITGKNTLSTLSVSGTIDEFCQVHYAPGYDSVNKCASKFSGAKSVGALIDAFCLAVSIGDTDVEPCKENLEMLAAQEDYQLAFAEARRQYLVDHTSTCNMTGTEAFDIYHLPTKLATNACQTGVELQYKNNAGNWVSYLGLPDGNPPCLGYHLRFTYGEHETLFHYPLRLFQKHLPRTCSACTHISGFDAKVELQTS